MNLGAKQDSSNGSLIRTSKKDDKLDAMSREGNIALEVDRPVLPTVTFSNWKKDLLAKADAGAKPNMKFL
jgi:hypothetical protein